MILFEIWWGMLGVMTAYTELYLDYFTDIYGP